MATNLASGFAPSYQSGFFFVFFSVMFLMRFISERFSCCVPLNVEEEMSLKKARGRVLFKNKQRGGRQLKESDVKIYEMILGPLCCYFNSGIHFRPTLRIVILSLPYIFPSIPLIFLSPNQPLLTILSPTGKKITTTHPSINKQNVLGIHSSLWLWT